MNSLRLTDQKAGTALFLALAGTLAAAATGPAELIPASALLAFGLSWASVVDVDRFILPDVLTLGLVATGLSYALWNGLEFTGPYLIGAAVGYLSLASIALVYQRLRGRSGLGLGDAKLLAVSGAWLGWTALPLVVLIASTSCILVVLGQAAAHRRAIASGPIPFGPYLAGATWMLWLVQIGGQA